MSEHITVNERPAIHLHIELSEVDGVHLAKAVYMVSEDHQLEFVVLLHPDPADPALLTVTTVEDPPASLGTMPVGALRDLWFFTAEMTRLAYRRVCHEYEDAA